MVLMITVNRSVCLQANLCDLNYNEDNQYWRHLMETISTDDEYTSDESIANLLLKLRQKEKMKVNWQQSIFISVKIKLQNGRQKKIRTNVEKSSRNVILVSFKVIQLMWGKSLLTWMHWMFSLTETHYVYWWSAKTFTSNSFKTV